MTNEQVLLIRDEDGKYVPYDSLNNKLCILIGGKNEILERVKDNVDKYYSYFEDLYFVNENTLALGIFFKNKTKYVLCNTEGKFICKYVERFIKPKDTKLNSHLIAYKDGRKYGFIDTKTGNMYETKWQQVHDFSEGLAAVQDPATKKWGYINENLYLVIACRFDKAKDYSENMAAVSLEINSLADLSNEELSLSKEDKDYIIKELKHGRIHINVYGIINKKGDFFVPFMYAYADRFQEGMIFTTTFGEEEKTGNGGAFINKEGKRYDYIQYAPTRFYDGSSYIHIDGGHYGPDKLYQINIVNDKQQIKEIEYDEYMKKYFSGRDRNKFDYLKQQNHSIYYRSSLDKNGYRFSLTNGKKYVNISLYDNIKNKIESFCKENKSDDQIYAYDFENDEIIPIKHFIIGSRNILSDEEEKPYVKRKLK